jgi:hypothetical protein
LGTLARKSIEGEGANGDQRPGLFVYRVLNAPTVCLLSLDSSGFFQGAKIQAGPEKLFQTTCLRSPGENYRAYRIATPVIAARRTLRSEAIESIIFKTLIWVTLRADSVKEEPPHP